MPAVMTRAYHALTGKEVIELITQEIRRQLSMDTDFGAHQSLREVDWTWKLDIKMFPRENPARTVSVEGKIQEHDPGSKKPIEGDEEPVLLEVTSSRNIDLKTPPDLVREKAGLPVPVTKQDPRTGEVYDIPLEIQQMQKKASESQDAKERSILAEQLRDKGYAVPRPVHGKVNDVRELARDVTEDHYSVSLGLHEDGAVKPENVTGPSPEAHLVREVEP